MEKRAVGTVILALACVLCGAVPLAGCGSGAAARIENPLEFFGQTRQNMQSAGSFRVSGEMAMAFEGVPGMEAMKIDYDMVCELEAGGGLLARMAMNVEEPYGLDMEAYILEDRMYMQMPGGIWVYEDMDLPSDLTQMGQGMGPQYLMDMLEMAETAEVVAEDEQSITYRLVLDYEKMVEEVQIEEMRKQFLDRGMPEEYIDAFKDMMKEMLSAMDVEVTAEKSSGMITRFGMKMEMDLGAMAPFIPEGQLPPGAIMRIDGEFTVSDYGKSFDIRLPDEAKGAVPMEEFEGLLEG